jgi:addiction module RelE/StbE family toxin
VDKIEKITWTEDAVSSFEDVVKYISEDSVFYASNFAKKILLLVEKLRDFPSIGRIVPEYSNPEIRELIYQNYRIVYKISGEVIYLLLITHCSQELPSSL